MVSVILSPAGSVEVYARATFAATYAHFRKTWSRLRPAACAYSVFCASAMLASAMGMNMMSPSFRGGMNSLPIPRSQQHRTGEEWKGDAHRDAPVIKRPRQCGTIETLEKMHHRVLIFRMGTSPGEAACRRMGVSVGAMAVALAIAKVFANAERMEELPFLSGQGKYRN